ncbi:MAG: tetratricopeptide repeat protein [Lentimicrobium sp.]
MRKLLLLMCLIWYFVPVLTGQNAILIDSLERMIPGSVGKTRTDLLNELGWELKFSNPDSSLMLTQEALTLAKSQSYTKGLALANRNMTGVNIIQGKIGEALPFAEKALIQIESIQEPYHRGKILNLLGVIHRDMKNFKKALDYQGQSLEIFRQLKDTFEIAGNLNNLGLIYKELGNSDEALKLYLEVYDLEVRRNNPFGIARTANNIASIYQDMQRFGKAEQMFRISIREARAINNKQFEAASIHGLGLLFQETGKPEEAIAEYKKAIEINRQAGFGEYLGNNLMQLASAYSSINKYNEAFQQYSEAFTVYSGLQNPWNQALALSGMARQQLVMGNPDKAELLANKAMTMGDSLNDISILADINFILYKIPKYMTKIGNIR